jgi:isopentenyldiphosphate isomerase
MELWDLYDRDRVKLGKTASRSDRDKLADGEYHLTVHAAIFNSDGKMLIQRRTDNKESWPGLWDITVGGAVVSGEDTRLGIERELEEELGIIESFKDARPYLTIHSTRCICDVYILVRDVDLESLVFQPTEVSAARYATLDEITELIKEGKFLPYRESYIRMLFDLKEGRGTHLKRP